VHLEETGKRRRVENTWTIPWGLHFDAAVAGWKENISRVSG